jgi:hypothetical protein
MKVPVYKIHLQEELYLAYLSYRNIGYSLQLMKYTDLTNSFLKIHVVGSLSGLYDK